MGSATTQALRASIATLEATDGVDLDVSRELFEAARVLSRSPQLSGALTTAAAPAQARQNLVAELFAQTRPATVAILSSVAGQRWSRADDMFEGIEELAVRAAAISAPDDDVAAELFEVSRVVAANPQLELALGSRLGDAAVKGELVESLLSSRAGEATTLIVSSLVQQLRARRVRGLLSWAENVVASQRGRRVATVQTAVPLSAQQHARVQSMLRARYDVDVALNVVVDPAVIGGLRIEIGDEVIDATVSSRLHDLRQRVAG